jgi:hypothetical protein
VVTVGETDPPLPEAAAGGTEAAGRTGAGAIAGGADHGTAHDSAGRRRWLLLRDHAVGPHKKIYQDYTDAYHGEDAVVLAVADGHGSAEHVHSHVGARYAVETFLRLGRDFAARAADGRLPLARLKADAEERVPRELVRAWRDGVLGHARRQHGLPGAPPGTPPPGGPRDLVPYGSTLIGAVVTESLVVGWQLGDGEFALVDPDGSVRLPLHPAGPDLGDETDSLCSHQAWDLVRVHWAPLAVPGAAPSLVLLSTDGLSKSFVDHEGYLDFVRGTHERLRTRGAGAVAADLPGWLTQASRFSGDDATVVAAWAAPDGTDENMTATPDPEAAEEE